MVAKTITPSSAPIWSIDLCTGQTHRRNKTTDLLCRLRLNEARDYVEGLGTLYWHLKSASLELRNENCRFVDGSFAFDISPDRPVKVEKAVKVVSGKNEERSRKTESGVVLSLNPSVKISTEGNSTTQEDPQITSMATQSYDVNSSVHLVSDDPPRFELGLAYDSSAQIQIRLIGQFIGSQEGMQEIAKVNFYDGPFAITSYLIFRPEDIEVRLSSSTGIYAKIFSLMNNNTDIAKKRLVNILLKKSCYPDQFKAEIALSGPSAKGLLP